MNWRRESESESESERLVIVIQLTTAQNQMWLLLWTHHQNEQSAVLNTRGAVSTLYLYLV